MDERTKAIQGLRQLADFLEAHPAVPLPVLWGLNAYARSRADLAAAARVGGWTKSYNDSWFALSREFGEGAVTLEINIERGQVCRKVVTGTRVVPAQPESVVETYDWVCDEPALLAEGA
jgi:hypothetical protein